jgi:tRNA(adenine34) deaminase
MTDGPRPEVDHERYMRLALAQARAAATVDEVPVGAVVVCDGRIVGEAHNRRELDQDPTAHAEILALRQAAASLGIWRLSGCTIYVTLEPCPMCAGALVHARVDALVYGCDDPKTGAVRSLYAICEDGRLNHRLQVEGGVLAEECGQLLRDFFAGLRARGEK